MNPILGWGFSAFALPLADEQTQRRVLRQSRRKGFHYARVAAELEGWGPKPWREWQHPWSENEGLPQGPSIESDISEWLGTNPDGTERYGNALDCLNTTLRIAAQEEMGLLVMAIATIRDPGANGRPTRTARERRRWVKRVCQACVGFDVAIQICNEYWHPRSNVTRDELLKLARLAKHLTAGASIPILSDDNFTRRNFEYDAVLKQEMYFPDGHVWRNPDPTREELQAIRDVNAGSGGTLISENVCWGTKDEIKKFAAWLCTASKVQILDHIRYVKEIPGLASVFHSVSGLTIPRGAGLTWLPKV